MYIGFVRNEKEETLYEEITDIDSADIDAGTCRHGRHRGGRHALRHRRGPHGHRGRGGPGGHRKGGRRGGRLFDYGELRLLVLAMIAERPSHGYELMKAIEERFGGAYSPSPGVIYPTLSWLEDMGYAAVDTEDGGRKRFSLTAEGEAFLAANRAAADALLARMAEAPAEGRPAPVIRSMENLKLALRLRFQLGPIDAETADAIAAAIDAAALRIEQL